LRRKVVRDWMSLAISSMVLLSHEGTFKVRVLQSRI